MGRNGRGVNAFFAANPDFKQEVEEQLEKNKTLPEKFEVLKVEILIL